MRIGGHTAVQSSPRGLVTKEDMEDNNDEGSGD